MTAPIDRTLGAGVALQRVRLRGACLRAGISGAAADEMLGNALTIIAAGEAPPYTAFLASLNHRRRVERVGLPRLVMGDEAVESLARVLAAEMEGRP